MTLDSTTATLAHYIVTAADRITSDDLTTLHRFYRDGDYPTALEFLTIYYTENGTVLHHHEYRELRILWRYWSQTTPHLQKPFPDLQRCDTTSCNQCGRTP